MRASAGSVEECSSLERFHASNISHCSCTIFYFNFVLFVHTGLVILILIDVQYLQNVVFSFEKGSNGRIHSSDSHHLIKKSPPNKISHFPAPQWREYPHSLNAIWKTMPSFRVKLILIILTSALNIRLT